MKDDFNYISLGPASGGKARRLVFLLHGVGMNGEVMRKTAQEISAEVPDALIVMPDAPEAYDPPPQRGESLLRTPHIPGDGTNAQQWFHIGGDTATVRDKLAGIAERFNRFASALRDEHGLEDKDIAFMGFSQGGGVALYAAFLRTEAETIGCAVGHSTIFYREPEMASHPPTLFLYGTADEEFNREQYAQSTQHLIAHQPAAQIVEIPGLQHRTSSGSRRTVAEFIRDALNDPPPAP